MDGLFMYMDESGDGGLPSPYGASNTRHMVYAGAVVSAAQNLALRRGVEKIFALEFGSDVPEELHYGDIINDRGIYDDMEGIQKKEIADAVFDLITDVEPTIIATVIDKKKHGNRYTDPWPPKPYIFRATVARFQYYCDVNSGVGMVVADAEQSFIDNELRQIVYNAKSDGVRIVEKGSKLTNIMDSVLFTPSEMSPGIQIADFIAYAIWSDHEYGNSRRWNQIKHLMRDPEGSGFTEPSLLPG